MHIYESNVHINEYPFTLIRGRENRVSIFYISAFCCLTDIPKVKIFKEECAQYKTSILNSGRENYISF